MKRRNPNACSACGGTELVDAVDNFGNAYRGCPNCRISIPPDLCSSCGKPLVDGVDRYGDAYRGCPDCRCHVCGGPTMMTVVDHGKTYRGCRNCNVGMPPKPRRPAEPVRKGLSPLSPREREALRLMLRWGGRYRMCLGGERNELARLTSEREGLSASAERFERERDVLLPLLAEDP